MRSPLPIETLFSSNDLSPNDAHFYDFEDIFANPEQRRLLRTPYEESINSIDEALQGLDDPNEDYADKILRLARGNI